MPTVIRWRGRQPFIPTASIAIIRTPVLYTDLATGWLLLLCVDGVYAQYAGKRWVREVVFLLPGTLAVVLRRILPGAGFRLEQRCHGPDPG